jgi:hypothetical protein
VRKRSPVPRPILKRQPDAADLGQVLGVVLAQQLVPVFLTFEPEYELVRLGGSSGGSSNIDIGLRTMRQAPWTGAFASSRAGCARGTRQFHRPLGACFHRMSRSADFGLQLRHDPPPCIGEAPDIIRVEHLARSAKPTADCDIGQITEPDVVTDSPLADAKEFSSLLCGPEGWGIHCRGSVLRGRRCRSLRLRNGAGRSHYQAMNAVFVSCNCGANFERTEAIALVREVGCFGCYNCGVELASWNSARHPVFRVLQGIEARVEIPPSRPVRRR